MKPPTPYLEIDELIGKEEKMQKKKKEQKERNREAGPRLDPTGDRPPGAEDNPGRRYRQRFGEQVRPRVHHRYIHVKQK